MDAQAFTIHKRAFRQYSTVCRALPVSTAVVQASLNHPETAQRVSIAPVERVILTKCLTVRTTMRRPQHFRSIRLPRKTVSTQMRCLTGNSALSQNVCSTRAFWERERERALRGTAHLLLRRKQKISVRCRRSALGSRKISRRST